MLDYNKNIEPRRSNAPANKSFTFDSRRAISQSTISSGYHRSRHPESSSSRRPPSSHSSSLHRRARSFSAPPRRVAQYMYQSSQQQIQAQNSTPSLPSQSKVTFSEIKQVSKSEPKPSTSGKNFLTSLVKNTIMSITKSSPSLTRRNSFSGSLNSDSGKQGEKQSTKSENKTVKSILHISKNKNSPGVVGITNHGNTCFINAIVQCLSNTQPLAEYLISNYDRFEKPLLLSFAALLKSLWTDRYEAKLSHRFRTRVGVAFEQFSDGSQNDAQEFLLLLLDRLQQELPEDCQTKNSFRVNDDPTNNIIKSLFEAKLTSCLTCSRCRNCSFATDTILTLCLPIQELVVIRTIYMSHSERKYRLFAFQVNSCDTIRQFKQLICQKVGALPKQIVLVHMDKHGHYRQLITDHMTLAHIMPTEYLYTVQLRNKRSSSDDGPISSLQHLHKQRKLDGQLSLRTNHLSKFRQNLVNGNNNNSFDASLRSSEDDNQYDEQFINIMAYPLVYNGKDFKSFGSLAAVSVSRVLSYRELQNILFNKLKIYFVSIFHTMNVHSMFRIRVHASDHQGIENYDSTDEDDYLSPKHEMPLLSLIVDRVLSHFVINGLGIPYLRVFVEFRQEAFKYIQNVKEQMIMIRDPSYDEHYSKKTGSTLASCLETFTQKEQLGSDNFWKCSRCQSRQSDTTKSLSFSSMPEVLIVHLKRFKQIGDERIKLETYVDFPLNDLELSRFTRSSSDQSLHPVASNNTTNRANRSWSDVLQSLPSKIGDKNSKLQASQNEDYTYDLFAICNHHGDLQSGHYTAFCQNSITKKWYKYDDEKVGEIPSTDVVTNSAYMLFYWRRGNRSHSPFSLNNFINEQRATNGNSSASKSNNGCKSYDSSHSLSADSLAGSTLGSASVEALNQLPVNVQTAQLKNDPILSTQSSDNINSQPLKSILKSSQTIAISAPALTQKQKSPPAVHVTINECVATVDDDGVSTEQVMENKKDQKSTATQPRKFKQTVLKLQSEDQPSRLVTTLQSKNVFGNAIRADVQSTKLPNQPREKKPLIQQEVQKMFIENHVKNYSSAVATPKKSANLVFEKVPVNGRPCLSSSASLQTSVQPDTSRGRNLPRMRFDGFKQESTV